MTKHRFKSTEQIQKIYNENIVISQDSIVNNLNSNSTNINDRPYIPFRNLNYVSLNSKKINQPQKQIIPNSHLFSTKNENIPPPTYFLDQIPKNLNLNEVGPGYNGVDVISSKNLIIPNQEYNLKINTQQISRPKNIHFKSQYFPYGYLMKSANSNANYNIQEKGISNNIIPNNSNVQNMRNVILPPKQIEIPN